MRANKFLGLARDKVIGKAIKTLPREEVVAASESVAIVYFKMRLMQLATHVNIVARISTPNLSHVCPFAAGQPREIDRRDRTQSSYYVITMAARESRPDSLASPIHFAPSCMCSPAGIVSISA